MTINVVNKRAFKGKGEYIGRPSVLGNPFSHLDNTLAKFKVATRDEAVQKYKEWLREQWKTNPQVKAELMRLAKLYKEQDELTLICWCKPQACHGDIVAHAIYQIVSADLV